MSHYMVRRHENTLLVLTPEQAKRFDTALPGRRRNTIKSLNSGLVTFRSGEEVLIGETLVVSILFDPVEVLEEAGWSLDHEHHVLPMVIAASLELRREAWEHRTTSIDITEGGDQRVVLTFCSKNSA